MGYHSHHLFQVHGQRHENLVALIGLLTEGIPSMVWEYCSRGSLHDVIKQQDIKLDWAFKLSLLTDLVRVSKA
jgi:guanylate cyclase 2F